MKELTVTISDDRKKIWISQDGFDAVYDITPSCTIEEIYKMYFSDKEDFFNRKHEEDREYEQVCLKVGKDGELWV